MWTLNFFGLRIKGEGAKGFIAGLLVLIASLICLPFVLIWSMNLLLGMHWKYTLDYWLAVFILFGLLCLFMTRKGED